MGDEAVNALLGKEHLDHFHIDLFERTIKHSNTYGDIAQRNEEKVVIENGLHKCTLQNRIGPLRGVAIHHTQHVLKVLQKHVSLSLPQTDFTIRPVHDYSEQYAGQNNAINRQYFHHVLSAVRQDITKDNNKDVHLIDDHDCAPSSSVGFVQQIPDKFVTSLKSTPLLFIQYMGSFCIAP